MRLIKYLIMFTLVLLVYGCGKNPMVTKLSQIDKGKRYRNEGFKSFILVWAGNRETFEFLPAYYNNIAVGRYYGDSNFQDKEGWIYSPDSKDYSNEYTKVRYIRKSDNTIIYSKNIPMEEVSKMEAMTYLNNDKFTFYLKLEVLNISTFNTHPVYGNGEYRTKDGIIVTINYENTMQGIIKGSGYFEGIIDGVIKASTDSYLFTLVFREENIRYAEGLITYNGLQIGTVFFKELTRDLGHIMDKNNDGYYTDEKGQYWNGVDWDRIGE